MITAPESQRALAEQVRREAEDLATDAQRMSLSLSPKQLAWSPGKKDWSIAQVFEHLCIAHDSYLDAIEQVVADPESPRVADAKRDESDEKARRLADGDASWSPGFAGAVMVRSLRSTRKLSAPRAFRIGRTIRPNVIAEFMARQARLIALLDVAAPLHWAECKFGSPVSAVIRLNLGDCFLILVEHARRHMAQVASLQRMAEFAAA